MHLRSAHALLAAPALALVAWYGADSNQADVPPDEYYQQCKKYIVDNRQGTRGVWSIPLPVVDTYPISVKGCDEGDLGYRSSKQDWTVPATITYAPLPGA